ncbi:AAA family ATPase [Tumebacillus permanentifrigoris]|uniref:Putative ATP-binding protein involved in virulence n=1 Tax=Tumebacillus permanentifrigoris TaxID=378543 RepID=A0A316DYI7_9BACL|nr:AAA family ATPase [Tumebacillus permanentifrigoris]PWK15570.1 putative ATP-binding protein involved in virulence [Tumebacillus permanentifrigoris]
MKITRVVVKGLFGIFDHDIPINTQDNITIIHGPNGFGKTALLKLVNSIFRRDFAELWKIPYHEIEVFLTDDVKLMFRKQMQVLNGIPPLQAFIYRADETVASFFPENNGTLNSIKYKLQEILTGNITIYGGNNSKEVKTDSSPYEYKQFTDQIAVHFIETQRLLNVSQIINGSSTTIDPVVELYSKEIVKVIESKLADSTALVQSLDRSLPVRLVEQSQSGHSLTAQDLQNKITSLEDKRTRLINAGLLDQDNNDINFDVFNKFDLSESTKNILTILLDDMEKKLGFFDETLEKIELLKKIVNKRFLYKKISISKDRGFLFTTWDDQALSPTDLSSGEQHELVLLYDLLFNMERGALILLDEPELSLHVAWQMEFLRDLQEIIALTDASFVIATHSPQIINDRWDLTVELKGPKQ